MSTYVFFMHPSGSVHICGPASRVKLTVVNLDRSDLSRVKPPVRFIDVICMHSAMLNVDMSSHRFVLTLSNPCRRLSDLSLLSLTICCTSFTQFPSPYPQPCCPTLVDASVSSSSRSQGNFTPRKPFGSGTSWSSFSISRAYGITPSSAPRKDRQSYSTSSDCVRYHSHS